MQTTSKCRTLRLSGVIQTFRLGRAGGMSSQSMLTTIVADWIHLVGHKTRAVKVQKKSAQGGWVLNHWWSRSSLLFLGNPHGLRIERAGQGVKWLVMTFKNQAPHRLSMSSMNFHE